MKFDKNIEDITNKITSYLQKLNMIKATVNFLSTQVDSTDDECSTQRLTKNILSFEKNFDRFLKTHIFKNNTTIIDHIVDLQFEESCNIALVNFDA